MLLSSFGRASLERAVVVSSGPLKSVPHNVLKSQYIRHVQFKAILLSITPSNAARRSYATGASLESTNEPKSTKSPTKQRRKVVKKAGTKKVKKPSAPSGRKKPAKRAVKKPAKKLVKKPRKVKRGLSDNEKKIIKHKLLKAQALEPPKPLPRTARTVFMAEKLTGYTGGGAMVKFSEIVSIWMSLSENQKMIYQKKAESNRIANDAAMKSWIASYTPDQIRLANNARRLLTKYKLSKRVWTPILDPRVPKRPVSSYLHYVRESYSTGSFEGLDFNAIARKHSAGFKALSPTERRRYDEMFLIDRKRYLQQYKEIFKREARIVGKDSQ